MIMERGKVRIRKKTKIQAASTNMKFVTEEPVLLDIPQNRLPMVVLLIHLVQIPKGVDQNDNGRPVQVGKVVIGPNLGDVAHQHWYKMISNPREPVIDTHALH